jgi:hypothetical protein
MKLEQNIPKRARPRISIRTSAILLTLMCCYAACWSPTKRRGVEDVVSSIDDNMHWVANEVSVAPLLVRADRVEHAPHVLLASLDECAFTWNRRYYFWFFGYVVELPFGQKVKYSVPIPFEFSLDV